MIEEVLAFQSHELISSVGGFLGLFLGASIMSLFSTISELILKIKIFIANKSTKS